MATSILVSATSDHRLVNSAKALAQNPDYDRIVIGVAIFDPSTKNPAVLIVKRSAHEDFLPNVWELPGGHVEDIDDTIIHAVRRETFEETGLEVSEIMGEFQPFVYAVEKSPASPGEAAPMKKTLQLNFAVRVSNAGGKDRVRLNPDEHQSHAWVTAESINTCEMTEGMLEVVSNALEWGQVHATAWEYSGKNEALLVEI